MLETNDLQLVLCPTGEPEAKYKHFYNEIYNCWSQVWTAAYKDANYKNGSNGLKSDSFTRQDFVAAVFYKNECVAFILFRHVDLTLTTTRDDSFFETWNEDHYQTVREIGSRILICGNLGVRIFRQKGLRISLKDLIGGIICEITLQSKANATIATPRRDHKVHAGAYRWGATPIAENISWGCGINVDLIAFRRDQILLHRDHELRLLVDNLWKNKIVIKEHVFEHVDEFAEMQPFSQQCLTATT